jgi:hypothetical protein
MFIKNGDNSCTVEQPLITSKSTRITKVLGRHNYQPPFNLSDWKTGFYAKIPLIVAKVYRLASV